VALLVLSGAGAGCTTEVTTSDGRPLAPEPRAARVVPAGAVPNQMTLVVGPKPLDANGNGYPDQIQVVTTLFSVPHYTGIEWDGAFVFTLYKRGDAGRAGATPIAEWRFEGVASRAAVETSMIGRGYRFDLSLLESGTDRLPPTTADIRGRFEPADGNPVVHASNQAREVQLGRAGSARSR